VLLRHAVAVDPLDGDMAIGPDVYVTPPTVPGDFGGGDGSSAHPFHSVAAGMAKAKANGGGIVRLHGGHYVESVRLENFGEDGQEMAVRADGGGEVFIDSMLPEFLPPKGPDDHWYKVIPPVGPSWGNITGVANTCRLVLTSRLVWCIWARSWMSLSTRAWSATTGSRILRPPARSGPIMPWRVTESGERSRASQACTHPRSVRTGRSQAGISACRAVSSASAGMTASSFCRAKVRSRCTSQPSSNRPAYRSAHSFGTW
jgi:hypothetical protein